MRTFKSNYNVLLITCENLNQKNINGVFVPITYLHCEKMVVSIIDMTIDSIVTQAMSIVFR